MSLTVERHNYTTGQAERKPVNEAVLQRFIDRFFVERLGRPPAWLSDPDRLYRELYVPTMRELTLADAPAIARVRAPDDDSWKAEVVALRFPESGEAMSWRGIAAKLGKPVSTVRRVAAEHAAEHAQPAGV